MRAGDYRVQKKPSPWPCRSLARRGILLLNRRTDPPSTKRWRGRPRDSPPTGRAGSTLAHESVSPAGRCCRGGCAVRLPNRRVGSATASRRLARAYYRVGARRGVAAFPIHALVHTRRGVSAGQGMFARSARRLSRASPAISTCSASATRARQWCCSAARRHSPSRSPIHRAGRSGNRPFILQLLGEAQVAVGAVGARETAAMIGLTARMPVPGSGLRMRRPVSRAVGEKRCARPSNAADAFGASMPRVRGRALGLGRGRGPERIARRPRCRRCAGVRARRRAGRAAGEAGSGPGSSRAAAARITSGARAPGTAAGAAERAGDRDRPPRRRWAHQSGAR